MSLFRYKVHIHILVLALQFSTHLRWNVPLIENVAEYNTKTAPGNDFSSSNFLLAQSSVPQCEQHSPTDPRELNANVDQMYQVTD